MKKYDRHHDYLSRRGTLGRNGVRVPNAVRPVPCAVCNKTILATDDYVVNPACQGKPAPCECGQPSMPYPNCAHCKGSGRIGGDLKRGELCTLCPPDAPCVSCCAKALIQRCRDARDGDTLQPKEQ
jgi:hypothetical protein